CRPTRGSSRREFPSVCVLYVIPGLALDSSVHGWAGNAVLLGERLVSELRVLWYVESSSLTNNFGGELGLLHLVSPADSSVKSLVLVVVLCGSPAEIAQLVVISISVVVTSMHILWRFTHEGEKRESVDAECLRSAVSTEIHSEIIAASRRLSLHKRLIPRTPLACLVVANGLPR